MIGGAAYLYEIGESVPTAAHALYYAEIVRDKAMARSLISASTNILKDAYDQVDSDSRNAQASGRKSVRHPGEKGGGRHEKCARCDGRIDGPHQRTNGRRP